MPELPEVETVTRELRPLLGGTRIVAVRRTSTRALRRPWDDAWVGRLAGQRMTGVRRRGKWIIIELESAGFLVVHLGMTGQLVAVDADTEVAAHTHLVLDLDSGRQLRFRDVRRFGSASLFPDAAALEAFFDENGLGPEPFDLDPKLWREKLAATRRNLKAILLDQGVVAGVGNIYADESLFQARLHPARRGCDLSRAEAERLRRAVVRVLNTAIEHRGSTIRDYVGGSGLMGGYQDEFRVYGRTGEPCPRCRTPVAGMRLAGRASHYCPRCQPKAG